MTTPITIQCKSCEKTLKVPASLIGKMMEGAMAMASKLKGTITQTHTNIQVNQGLKSTDLVFNPLATAKLMPSPLKQSMKEQQK